MSRWGRVGLLCVLALVVWSPTQAWAEPGPAPIVSSPSDGQTIPLIEQPMTFSIEGLTDGTPVEAYEIDARGGAISDNLCPGIVTGSAGTPGCTTTAGFFMPGQHTFRVVAKYDDPSGWDEDSFTDVDVTIGPSALQITSKTIEPGTNVVTVTGTRDPGERFGVLANFDDHTEGSKFALMAFSQETCDISPPSGNQFNCTKDFADDLPAGTTIDVSVMELVAEVEAHHNDTQLIVGGPVVNPPVDPPVDPPQQNDDGSPAPGPLGSIPGGPVPSSPPGSPDPTSPTPAPTSIPDSPDTQEIAAPVSPSDDDALKLLLLAAIAFAILALIGPHGLAYASDQVRRQRERGADPDGVHLLPVGTSPGQADESSMALVLAALAARDKGKDRGEGATHARQYGIRWGDRSWSWQFAGWKQVDRASRHTPMNLARRFPLIARIGADANYLRAVFGALWLLLPLAGIGLGVLAADNSGGLPVAQSVAITATLLVFAIFDATSGAAALLGFTAVVLVRGDMFTLGALDSLRGLLGLAALWFAIPLIAAAARPFRRLSQPEHVYRWDRLGDGVIAALIGGLAVYATSAGFANLVDRPAAISHHAGALALMAATAVLVRVAIEELIMVGYPARLRAVQHTHPLAEPTRPHRLRGIVIRGLLVALFASAVIGNCWQLWVGVALCVVPQVLSLVEDHLPNITELHRRLPRGIVEFFIMLAIGLILARLIADTYDDDRTMALRDGFLLLATPSFFLTTLGILGRTSPAPPWTWPRQIAGAMFVVATLLVALIVF